MADGIGSHQSHRMGTDIWLTPPDLLKALGHIDLDPCAAPQPRPWPTADEHYALPQDGLSLPWHGFCFVNSPYGYETGKWLEKLAKHNNGIGLIFARTETKIFSEWVWPYASSLLFIEGRLFFHNGEGWRADHNSGAPSVLIGYGEEARNRLLTSGIRGAFVESWKVIK